MLKKRTYTCFFRCGYPFEGFVLGGSILTRVLSLFSGCGGLDIGFEGGFDLPYSIILQGRKTRRIPKTGFQTVFANDVLETAKIAWESYFNRKETFVVESIVDLVKKHNMGVFTFPEADIVTGGFPCQDFSLAGNRMGFKSKKSHNSDSSLEYSDPTTENRGMLYFWMKEVISIVKPKIFVAENVKGLESLKDVKATIERDFSSVDHGYIVKACTLNAGDFGVPQNRERVIFIGLSKKLLSDTEIKVLEDESFSFFPEKPYDVKNKRINTVWHAIGKLPEPERSDDKSHQKYSGAKWYGKHCQGNIEIKLNGLAPTIRSEHHGNIEFRRLSKSNGGTVSSEYHLPQRRLSIRECARLQSFPDSCQFVQKGISATAGYKLVGNAVPPLLGFFIASKVQELYEKVYKPKQYINKEITS